MYAAIDKLIDPYAAGIYRKMLKNELEYAENELCKHSSAYTLDASTRTVRSSIILQTCNLGGPGFSNDDLASRLGPRGEARRGAHWDSPSSRSVPSFRGGLEGVFYRVAPRGGKEGVPMWKGAEMDSASGREAAGQEVGPGAWRRQGGSKEEAGVARRGAHEEREAGSVEASTSTFNPNWIAAMIILLITNYTSAQTQATSAIYWQCAYAYKWQVTALSQHRKHSLSAQTPFSGIGSEFPRISSENWPKQLDALKPP
ncbi:hypothetical protein C8R45DRAFT_939400 [Mycena sanguinolenta]|nr:hypothetical protein C8R45DRAFT_939400 [Mycena sanguinolenta]